MIFEFNRWHKKYNKKKSHQKNLQNHESFEMSFLRNNTSGFCLKEISIRLMFKSLYLSLLLWLQGIKQVGRRSMKE